MGGQYLTLDQNDDSLLPTMEGRLDLNHRALPVPSLSRIRIPGKYTFEIKKKEELKIPSLPRIILAATRPVMWTLLASPFLTTFAYVGLEQTQISPIMIGLSFLALVLLQCFVFVYNDYQDHMNGVDQFGLHSGSRVIQKGWLPAFRVKQIAIVFLILSLGLGAIVISMSPSTLLPVSLFALICALGFSLRKRGFKYTGLGELIIFLCLGPLLTLGVSQFLGATYDFDLLSLGLWFGLSAVGVFHFRNMENILADGMAKNATWAIRFGFDQTRKFLIFYSISLAIFFPLLILFIDLQWTSIIWGLVYIFGAQILVRRLLKTKSPVSSSMQGLKSISCRLHLLSGVLLFGFMVISK